MASALRRLAKISSNVCASIVLCASSPPIPWNKDRIHETKVRHQTCCHKLTEYQIIDTSMKSKMSTVYPEQISNHIHTKVRYACVQLENNEGIHAAGETHEDSG